MKYACSVCKKEFTEKEIWDHLDKRDKEILKNGRGIKDNPCGCFPKVGEHRFLEVKQ